MSNTNLLKATDNAPLFRVWIALSSPKNEGRKNIREFLLNSPLRPVNLQKPRLVVTKRQCQHIYAVFTCWFFATIFSCIFLSSMLPSI